jgi:integrase
MSPKWYYSPQFQAPPVTVTLRSADTIDTMQKPWVYKRKGIKGWWTGWYEGGKRKAKALPTKALAEHFRNIKYVQLNSDVFTSVVDFDWQQMRNEYHHAKQVDGLQEVSIYEALLTLQHFERLVAPSSSRQITQQSLDTFVLERGKEVKRDTLNKDIRNISAFLNWGVKNRYVPSGLEIKKVRVSQKPVIALSPQQVRNLIMLVSDHATLRWRVLLAATTGLRRGDIEAMCIGDIHFDRNTITTRNRKAKKAMAERPIPEQVTTELSNYVATLPVGQELLFTDRFPEKRWKKIRCKVGLPDLKFHDLRKTFASLLAQRGVSTAVTQRLLEHSTPQLTNQIYTNVDPVLRQAINLLPVAEWL